MVSYIITPSWFTQKSLWGRKDGGPEKLVPLHEVTWPENDRLTDSNQDLFPLHPPLFPGSFPIKCQGVHWNVKSWAVSKHDKIIPNINQVLPIFWALGFTFTGIISFNPFNSQMTKRVIISITIDGETEAWRGEVTYPSSYNQQVARLQSQLKLFRSLFHVFPL